MSALEQSLHEHLDTHEPTSGFVIDDNDKADWALRKIKQHQQALGEAEALAKREIGRIQQWLDGQREEHGRSIEFFESRLRPFAETQLADSKSKTLTLPNGSMSFRKSQPWQYDDEQLLGWLKERGARDLIRVKESPDKSGLKKVVEVTASGVCVYRATGEVVDGVQVDTAAPDSFSVEVNLD